MRRIQNWPFKFGENLVKNSIFHPLELAKKIAHFWRSEIHQNPNFVSTISENFLSLRFYVKSTSAIFTHFTGFDLIFIHFSALWQNSEHLRLQKTAFLLIPKSISHKIWVTENSWNFHTVSGNPDFLFVNKECSYVIGWDKPCHFSGWS